MTWKERYIRIYIRFVKERGLKIRSTEIDNILTGKRLIFGMCAAYHHGYAIQWATFIMPLMKEHFIQLVQRSGRQMKRAWNDDEFLSAYRMCSMMTYFNSLVSKNFDVDELFARYREINDEEILIN